MGLRRVAEAAGVSHGLVTHYFGTYGELVRLSCSGRTSGSGSGYGNACEPPQGVPYADA